MRLKRTNDRLYHLLRNEAIIKDDMFPVTYFVANGATWTRTNMERPLYFDIGETGYGGNVDDRTLSLIADLPPTGRLHGTRRLLDIAVVIRSKDAGVNRLTFDVNFDFGRRL